MSVENDRIGGTLLRGALAGAMAGAAASFAMDQFQSAVSALSSSVGDDKQEEPSTAKAADRIATALTGTDVPSPDKPIAGQAMHYALGIGLGVAYAIAAEFRPVVTTGFGAAFGLGTATVLDETAVPAFGLGKAPWKAKWSSHLYSYASHLVFGTTTELVRRRIVGTLRA